MALAFHYRSALASQASSAARVAVLPGAWNPPTVAHLAIARAALGWAAEVILVLPRVFPHKTLDGADFRTRLAMLQALAEAESGLSVATSEGGLYLEIARETADIFGPDAEIGLVCGRDAAERITAWDYGRPGVFREMLSRHPLLVASRSGEYLPPAEDAARVIPLHLPASFNEVSSTEVRNRILLAREWEHLVPRDIHAIAAECYGRTPISPK